MDRSSHSQGSPPRPPRWRCGAAAGAVLFALMPGTARDGHAEPLQPCPAGGTVRERQCLVGPVRSVASSVARFTRVDGEWVEAPAKPSWIDPTIVFDLQGNLAEELVYEPDGSLRSEAVYVYDSGGRHREVIRFGADGALQARTALAHDGRGRKTGERRYDADGVLRARVTFDYDVLGRLIEETVYRDDGAFVLKWVYSYDPEGHRSREALYTAHGLAVPGAVSKTYAYQEAPGPVEEFAFDAGGTLVERLTCAYDGAGHRIEERRYDPEGFLLGTTAFAYEFDRAGNWVKRTRVKRFGNLSVRPLDVTYRTLTYFEDDTFRLSRQ